MRSEGLRKFINSIGSRTRDLTACCTVPQPLRCWVLQNCYLMRSRTRDLPACCTVPQPLRCCVLQNGYLMRSRTQAARLVEQCLNLYATACPQTQLPYQVPNPRPYGLLHGASTSTLLRAPKLLPHEVSNPRPLGLLLSSSTSALPRAPKLSYLTRF
jgi:hypothetical protein